MSVSSGRKSFLFLLVKFSCCIFTLLELHGKTSHCFVSSVVISALLYVCYLEYAGGFLEDGEL